MPGVYQHIYGSPTVAVAIPLFFYTMSHIYTAHAIADDQCQDIMHTFISRRYKLRTLQLYINLSVYGAMRLRQDLVWGCTFFLKKLTTFLAQQKCPKTDFCSVWGALTIFPVNYA